MDRVEAFDIPPTLPFLDRVGESALKGDGERRLPTAAGEGERRPRLDIAPAPPLRSKWIGLKLPMFGLGGKLDPVPALGGILVRPETARSPSSYALPEVP